MSERTNKNNLQQHLDPGHKFNVIIYKTKEINENCGDSDLSMLETDHVVCHCNSMQSVFLVILIYLQDHCLFS